MVPPSAGAVVLVTFPFSDLSQAKLRPAVVLAAAGKGEYRAKRARLWTALAGRSSESAGKNRIR